MTMVDQHAGAQSFQFGPDYRMSFIGTIRLLEEGMGERWATATKQPSLGSGVARRNSLL